MKNFKKRYRMIWLAAAIAGIAGTLTGCSGFGTLFPDGRILRGGLGNSEDWVPGNVYEKTVETIGAEENIRTICVDSSLVDVKIYSAKEKGKSVSDGEILMEKNVGKKSPDVDVYAENGVLNITQPEQEKQDFPYNSEVFIYLPENIELENIYAEGEDGDIEISGNLSIGKMTIELTSGSLDLIGNVSVTSNLSVKTITGMIEIDHVSCSGSLNLYSESGDIEFFGNTQGNMSAETGDGAILISGSMRGDLKVDTCIGKIELDDVSCNGRLSLYSESGDIEFSGDVAGKLTAQTGRGDIDVYDTATDHMALTSCVGHISVSLDGDARDYNYDIASESGDLDLNGEVSSGILNTVKKKNNWSGRKIAVSTESGDIEIETEE